MTTGAGSPGPATNSPTGASLAEPAGGAVASLGRRVDGASAEPVAESGAVEVAESIAGAGVAAASEAVVEVADDSPPPLLATLVSSRKPTTTASTPSTAICATGLSFRAFLTSGPPTPAAAEPERRKAPTCRRRSA